MSADIAFVHGFATDSRRTWSEAGWLELVGDAGRNAYAIDLLGHGQADKPHESEAYRDLHLWVDERLPPGRIDAIGFSLGGQLLLTLAALKPERFERLVLLGVGDTVFESASDPSLLVDALRGTADETDRHGQHFAALASEPDSDPEALIACLQRPRFNLTEEMLCSVEIPVLIALGDADFVGPADRLVAALPTATFTTLRGVDHFVTPKSFDALSVALEFVGAGL
ncbi:MAG: alpha/beta fold hydrolase [Acidobacteria bacterium]|nr:alpha/beta fold hydrolase [Acidobacteriota bacterium]